jgi:hypothetical protein
MKQLLLISFFVLLAGCEDKYQKGYETGFNDGVSVTEKKLKEIIDRQKEQLERLERRSNSYSGAYSTEVCDGGGVTVNGKHHSGGKTGCVRVYSDGRIEKY